VQHDAAAGRVVDVVRRRAGVELQVSRLEAGRLVEVRLGQRRQQQVSRGQPQVAQRPPPARRRSLGHGGNYRPDGRPGQRVDAPLL
jgi:hypothetical protein